MKKYVEETIRFYDNYAEEYVRNTSSLQDTPWLNNFCDYLSPKSRILDVGCAFGRDTAFFADRGFETYGVDLSARMIELAKDNVPSAKFFVMDLLSLDLPDQFFDGIWCSAVLVHVSKRDTATAIGQLRRVLRPGGFLYINVKLGFGERIEPDMRYNGAKKFYVYYTKEEIDLLLRNSGFNPLEWEVSSSDASSYRDSGVIYVIARDSGSREQVVDDY